MGLKNLYRLAVLTLAILPTTSALAFVGVSVMTDLDQWLPDGKPKLLSKLESSFYLKRLSEDPFVLRKAACVPHVSCERLETEITLRGKVQEGAQEDWDLRLDVWKRDRSTGEVQVAFGYSYEFNSGDLDQAIDQVIEQTLYDLRKWHVQDQSEGLVYPGHELFKRLIDLFQD
jgi:hypothetical protein